MYKDEPLAKKAGRNLKFLIKNRNMTQECASRLLNVEERTLRRWIKDGIDRISTIEQICEVFELESITTLLK